MKNFLVVAMGRSGTKFLATNMNRSKKWTVLHEIGKWRDMQRSIKEIQGRLNKNFYGEVNGYLLHLFERLRADKKGIILRNPIDLWFSITTWHSQAAWAAKKKEKWQWDFNRLMQTVPRLLNLAESGKYFVIEFDRMVTEKEYLKNIFDYFGIDDVKVTKQMVESKINQSPLPFRTTWDDFSWKTKNAIEALNEAYLRRTDLIFKEQRKTRKTKKEKEPESEETKEISSEIILEENGDLTKLVEIVDRDKE